MAWSMQLSADVRSQALGRTGAGAICSRAVNHPGQSGDPESPHYRDLAPLWRNGDYFRLAYTRKAVEGVTERVIHLLPAP